MSPSSDPNPAPPSASSTSEGEKSLEQLLQETEEAFQALKERYTQIQQAQQRQAELKHRIDIIHADLRQSPSVSLKTELKQLQEQLEAIEAELESRLLSWSSFSEPFWQAVRFGGLGIAIGWLLKSCAG
jgi:chromosome segregation ATPase